MGSYTATYRVPKERVTVRMLLRNESSHRFELFLPIRPERRPPGQILRELLEQDRPFFPGRDLDLEDFVLISRDAVVWAEVDKDPERELDHLELYDYRQRVRVEIAVGDGLEGDVYYTAPSAKARLMDHLNGAERFVFLHGPDTLWLVNKSFIELVRELPERRSTMTLPLPDDEPESSTSAEPEETRGQD